jgi:HEAT repeat protein
LLKEDAMAVTLEQVRAFLDAEEPNYAVLARLGPQILPHLQSIIASGDEYFATKAASLASRINDERATTVLRDAARHASPRVRLAVAGGIRNVARPAAAGLLMTLLNDRDPGVRKTALKTAATKSNSALLAKIGDLTQRDPSPAVRTLAVQVLNRARRT